MPEPGLPEHLSRRKIETQPSFRAPIPEKPATGTLDVTVMQLQALLDTLPADHPAQSDTAPFIEEARSLLEQLTRPGVDLQTTGNSLQRVKELRDILENFNQAIRLQQARRAVAQTKPGEHQRNYDDEQGIRQRYEALIQKKLDLEQQLDSWRNIFRRGQLQQSLQMVGRDMKSNEKKFPFVLQTRDFSDETIRQKELTYQTKRAKAEAASPSERQDALRKVVAVQKASASVELGSKSSESKPAAVGPEAHRKDGATRLAELQQLLQNPPRHGQDYNQWYQRCARMEDYLSIYGKVGNPEQLQVAKYWKDKITVLETIKPVLFGRTEWQKQYQHAREERAFELNRAQTAQLRASRRAA